MENTKIRSIVMGSTKTCSIAIETTDRETQRQLTECFNNQEFTEIYISNHRVLGKVKQISQNFSPLGPAEPFTARIEIIDMGAATL